MSGLGDYWYKLIIRATDEDYPDIIHLPHVLISMTSYRQWRKQEGQPFQWLFDLVVSYWSHSQAGGAFCKGLLVGWDNLSLHTNPKHLQFHVIGYLITYFSPRNFVDRMVATPRHPARLFCLMMDALDANTSLFGLMDLSRKLHPANNVLPYIVGVLGLQGGAIVRWMESRLRGQNVKALLAAPGSGVTKGLVLALLWSWMGYGQTRNRNLVALSTIFTFLDVLQDAFDFDVYADTKGSAEEPLSR